MSFLQRIRSAALPLLLVVGGTACVSSAPEHPVLKPWSPGSSLTPAVIEPATPQVRESAAIRRRGQEIVIAGELVSIGVPVVLWTDPNGYNAYTRASERESFGRGRPTPSGSTVSSAAGIREVVDQFVLHYDACGVSRECFKALEARGLSVHFLLDIDGTLYQTLDLAEKAWHARQANGRSIGVEIANIGAYPKGDGTLRDWYRADQQGIRLKVPGELFGGGVRTPGFIGRPANPQRVAGEVNGRWLEQHDFTPQQYESLARLTAALVKSFPKLGLRFPTDTKGRIRTGVLSDAEFERFSGVLGHQHVTTEKTDPGPAFNWKAFALRTRQLLVVP